MGWFDFLKRKADTLVCRTLESARLLPLEYSGRGERRSEVKGCSRCGGKLEEILITTGGPERVQGVWRSYPLAVDGWRCTGCGDFRVPRFLEPEEVASLSKQSVEAIRAGDYDAAELGFRRIVSSWSDYGPGRHDLALAMMERLRAGHGAGISEFEELSILDRIELQLEKALKLPPPPPRMNVISLLVKCYLWREQPHRAFELMASERQADGTEETGRALDELEKFIRLRGDLYERGAEAIRPYIRLQESPGEPVDERARRRIETGVDDLIRHAGGNPASWQALWIAAKGLQAIDDHDGSQALFARAFTAHPSIADIGREYCLELLNCGKSAEAVKVAEQTSEGAPSDAGLVANLAMARLLAQDVPGALLSAERAVSMAPDDPISRSVLNVVQSCAAGVRPIPRTLDELKGRGN